MPLSNDITHEALLIVRCRHTFCGTLVLSILVVHFPEFSLIGVFRVGGRVYFKARFVEKFLDFSQVLSFMNYVGVLLNSGDVGDTVVGILPVVSIFRTYVKEGFLQTFHSLGNVSNHCQFRL